MPVAVSDILAAKKPIDHCDRQVIMKIVLFIITGDIDG